MSSFSTPRRLILPKIEPGTELDSSQYGSTSSDSTPTKRQCISSACKPCRRRRSKCDGERPACAACTSVHQTRCEYDVDGDRRRRSALKRDIDDLESKKDRLQFILTSIKNRPKPDVDAIVQMIRSNQDGNFDAISEAIQKLKDTSILDPAPSWAFLGKSNQNYNMLLSSEQPQRNESSFPRIQVGFWTQVTNDVDLIRHLLDLYFTWAHPFFVLFLEELFYHDLHNKRFKYSTPLLVNAVLAVGCLYSNPLATRTVAHDFGTSGDNFFAEAKRLLAAECRASLTTVAALGVMSIRESMKAETSNGLEYARQMMSMSAELGLHMDQASLESFKDMTAPDAEARRVTFWGTYAVETYSTMCLGRISGLPRIAVKMEKPYPSHLENKLWRPYGHRYFSNHSLQLEQPSFTYSLAWQLCSLTEIANDAGHLLYAPRSGNSERKLRQLHQRYEAWHRNLPKHLDKKGTIKPTLPQVLALHMYYCSCIIQLFRPFMTSPFTYKGKSANAMNTEAAIALSNLLEQYRRTYDFTHVFLVMAHSAMTAGMQHLYDMSSKLPAVAAQASLYLRDSIRALRTMRTSILASDLYLRVLADLIKVYAPNPPQHIRRALSDAGIILGQPTYNSSQAGSSLAVGGTVSQPNMNMQGFNSMMNSGPLFSQQMLLPPYPNALQNTFQNTLQNSPQSPPQNTPSSLPITPIGHRSVTGQGWGISHGQRTSSSVPITPTDQRSAIGQGLGTPSSAPLTPIGHRFGIGQGLGTGQVLGIGNMWGSALRGNLAQLHQGVLALGAAGSDVNVDIDIETWRARQPET